MARTTPKQSQTLQQFLKKEVLSQQIKHPSDTRTRHSRKSPATPLAEENFDGLNDDDPELYRAKSDDADSLFGDGVTADEEQRKLEVEQFLAKDEAQRKKARQNKVRKDDTKVTGFKDELRILIIAELEAGDREKALIQRQKGALIQEIRFLEAEEQNQKFHKRGLSKAELQAEVDALPPPITGKERRHIAKARKRAEEVMFNPPEEVVSSEETDNDNSAGPNPSKDLGKFSLGGLGELSELGDSHENSPGNVSVFTIIDSEDEPPENALFHSHHPITPHKPSLNPLQHLPPTPSPKKRTRSSRNAPSSDDDLDGEERLQLHGPPPPPSNKAKTSKKPSLELTGRWHSTNHDYLPEGYLTSEDPAADHRLRELCRTNDPRDRMELAQFLKAAAKADRVKKHLGR
ncbi:hypothetical protein BJ875DRAFT_457206 [Amylocarpus encephaloides]|uniref:Uncharacterized protein n=1 Tax=Amylocarpus encephaloides TaxID=45428 RepID=A0A9P7YN83_9HELO|nr:hypothetical protein BJ875DRAFT_457206 [Amylocarpus encephaloides]